MSSPQTFSSQDPFIVLKIIEDTKNGCCVFTTLDIKTEILETRENTLNLKSLFVN